MNNAANHSRTCCKLRENRFTTLSSDRFSSNKFEFMSVLKYSTVIGKGNLGADLAAKKLKELYLDINLNYSDC